MEKQLAELRDSFEAALAQEEKDAPPGRAKIERALRMLLEEKDFGSITTAEIAKTAGVTEPLIYKYFKDKRDLLYQVLAKYLNQYIVQLELHLKGIDGSLNKLRKLIWYYLHTFATARFFGRILILEIRGFPDFFESETLQVFHKIAGIELGIIEEGIRNGEIRPDLSPAFIRKVIRGSVENLCLPWVAFSRGISPDELTEDLCRLIFAGIQGNSHNLAVKGPG